MNGIQNFLQCLSDEWVGIVIAIALGILLGRQIGKFLRLDRETKIATAKMQVKEIMLKLITDAEIDFAEWNKSGSIKRSKVISEIFERYPILSKVTSTSEVINWIDTEIDESLKTLREILKENK